MKLALLFALVLSTAPAAMAHMGHDHDTPTTLKAPKGGVIKSLDEAHVEVVNKGKDLKVYVYDQASKPAQASRFNIVAEGQLPRGGKKEVITLAAKDTYFEGAYDAKGSHRYTLRLTVTDSKTTRTDTLTYTIEPRK